MTTSLEYEQSIPRAVVVRFLVLRPDSARPSGHDRHSHMDGAHHRWRRDHIRYRSRNGAGTDNVTSYVTGNTLTSIAFSGVRRASITKGPWPERAWHGGVERDRRHVGALPTPPTGLAATVSGSTVTLSWSPPGSGIQLRHTFSKPDRRRSFEPRESGDERRRRDSFTGVPPGVYYLRVRARNVVGTSGPSNEIQATSRVRCRPPHQLCVHEVGWPGDLYLAGAEHRSCPRGLQDLGGHAAGLENILVADSARARPHGQRAAGNLLHSDQEP